MGHQTYWAQVKSVQETQDVFVWGVREEVTWFSLLLSVCLQLAVCTGEHQLAAASVPAAEGGPAGGPRSGPRPQARPGALLRRLGPHTSDCCSVQAPAGPLLPHYRGTSEAASFSPC